MPYQFVCKFSGDQWTVAKTLGEDSEGITAEGATPYEFRKALKAAPGEGAHESKFCYERQAVAEKAGTAPPGTWSLIRPDTMVCVYAFGGGGFSAGGGGGGAAAAGGGGGAAAAAPEPEVRS
eukprot:scaffold5350_cov362-Prasinococcus_capsulatus_cf.AAC.4